MTIFKGLATAETTLGLQPGMTLDGTAAIGGGWCSFSTSFGVPPTVVAAARATYRRHKQFRHSDAYLLPDWVKGE